MLVVEMKSCKSREANMGLFFSTCRFYDRRRGKHITRVARADLLDHFSPWITSNRYGSGVSGREGPGSVDHEAVGSWGVQTSNRECSQA